MPHGLLVHGLIGPYNIFQRSFHASTSKLAAKNPYQTLGVGKNAGASEIKKAYYQVSERSSPSIEEDSNLIYPWVAARKAVSPRYKQR